MNLLNKQFPKNLALNFNKIIGARQIAIDNKISNDPYYVLGVDRNAKFTEIKKEYFSLAKKYHPDLNPNDEVSLNTIFTQISLNIVCI